MNDVSSLPYPTRQTAIDDRRPGPAELAFWLLERRKTLALATVVGAMLAYAGGLSITPQYDATASLFVDNRSIQPLATPPGQGPSSDNNAEVSFVESQVKIITSQRVLTRVVAGQDLASNPEFGGGASSPVTAVLRNLLGIAQPAPESEENRNRAARAALGARLTVRRPERTFIIDVSVRANDPDEAARLANAVAQSYLDDQDAAHSEMARRASGALTGRLDELRRRLTEAETRVQAFKDQHGLVGTRQQLSSEQQLTDANAQLAQARAQRIQSRAHLDQLSSMVGSPRLDLATPETTASATISLLRGKQADARRQLASALAQFGPRYPAVRDARDQLADLDGSIQTELRRIREAAQVDYRRATASENAAGAVVNRLSAAATETSGALAQLAQMQQEVDIDKNLLNTVISRAQETGEMERMEAVTARVISAAEPPLRRAWPPRGIIFAVLGGALGFWLALAWIVLSRLGAAAALRRRLDQHGPDQRLPRAPARR